LFHETNSEVGIALNVTRHPYSFIGDSKIASMAGASTPEGSEPTWHDSLLGYCGGSEARRAQAEDMMARLAHRAGITLDYHVKTQWQPVESQRVLLWSAKKGLAEKYMSALARKHFEERTSASHRATVVAAAVEAGMDKSEVESFLDTDELRKEVWDSYRTTIDDKGIHAIPLFVFNLAGVTDGGPFRSRGPRAEHWEVQGSGNAREFAAVFEEITRKVEQK